MERPRYALHFPHYYFTDKEPRHPLPDAWRDEAILISINEEHGPEHDISHLPQSIPVLVVKFTDQIYAPLQHGEGTLHPISATIATAIVNFVDQHPQRRFVLIHCHAGVSRSASVALGLCYTHGLQLRDNFFHYGIPDPFITGHVVAAHAALRDRQARESEPPKGIIVPSFPGYQGGESGESTS